MSDANRLRTEHHVRLLQSGAVPDALAKAQAELLAGGSPAARAILDAVASSPPTPAMLTTLTGLVRPDTFGDFADALRSPVAPVADAAARALASSATWDPRALLPLYRDDRVARDRLDLALTAQAARVPAAEWLRALEDESEAVREAAVQALVGVRSPERVRELAEALRMADGRLRARAAEALGVLGGPGVTDAVLELLHDPDPFTRRYATEILNASPDERAVTALAGALRDEDWWVRERAADALHALAARDLPAPLRDTIARALASAGATRPASPATPTPAREWERLRPSGSGAGAPAAAEVPRGLDLARLEPGTVLAGRFRIVSRIGSGGFGTVYRAEDRLVHEEVVLKVLAPQLSRDPETLRRFVREMKLARRIVHPNVIRIHDLLDLGDSHAISMEWFDGRDLGRVLHEDGPLSHARVRRIAEQALEGLAAAHEAGVLHRDLKPGNLLVGEGDAVRIVDFGLASAHLDGMSRLTRSGMMVGTPEYISPEQIEGLPLDGRSDLYSLGVVLHESLTGHPAFEGTNPANVLFRVLEGAVPPVHESVPGVPLELSRLIASTMSRRPEDRPDSAATLLERFRALP
jgi:eukaryotic-like serine/threonine-protein kinase